MPSPFPNLPPFLRGSIRCLDVSSQALRDNPWGDPSHRDLYVYTPPGYETDGMRYPVILMLAGFAGTGEGMLARGLSEVSVASRMDRLINGYDESGDDIEPCPKAIVVLPDVMSTLVGSQYMDSPSIGNYATYLVKEVIPFVNGRFRTSGRWAVTGRSSGGFGALSLSMSYPGTFAALACHAGDMGFDLCYLGDLPKGLAGIRAAGGPQALVKAFWKSRRPSSAMFAGMNLLCMAAAYSPDPSRTDFPARLPVDWETGVIDYSVLRSWQTFDPVVRVDDPAVQSALRALRLLFIDAGDRDEYHLHLGARRLVAKLKAHDVPHVYEEFPGGHRGTSYRYDVSLPRLAQALIEE
ncbi:MAG: alpha/beta hydrolase-fold protein [Myxococcota bacterium]